MFHTIKQPFLQRSLYKLERSKGIKPINKSVFKVCLPCCISLVQLLIVSNLGVEIFYPSIQSFHVTIPQQIIKHIKVWSRFIRFLLLHRDISKDYFEDALLAFRDGDYQSGFEKMHTAAKMNPYEPKYYYALGSMFFATAHTDQRYKRQALEYYEIAESLNPQSMEIKYHIAVVLQSLGEYSEALEIYKTVLSTDPHRFECMSHMGVIYYKLNDLDNALECFETVLSFDKTHPESNYHMGLIKFHNAKFKTALKYLKRVKKYAESSELDMYLGLCYKELGDLDSALVHLLNAASAENADCKIHTSFAEVLDMSGDHELASEQWRLAQEFEPLNYEFLISRAKSLSLCNMLDQAIQEVLEVLQTVPTDRPLLNCLADLYQKAGQIPLAERYRMRANTYNYESLGQ